LPSEVELLRDKIRWMLHNGGTWCVEWPKEWRPKDHPPLLKWLEGRIDEAVAKETNKGTP
jgi:hypothetical protein